MIAGILEDPASHKGKVYPLFGPVEYSYQETAQVLSRVLGKEIEYKQVDFEEFKQTLQAGAKTSSQESILEDILCEVRADARGKSRG